MPPEAHKLTAADRAELCSRVDLLDLLRRDGVDARRVGATYVCTLRGERTPSCHLYPPGTGRRGHAGWTMKDFGDGWGGDVLAYLMERRGQPFPEAVAELCRLAGWTPAGWQLDRHTSPRTAERRGVNTLPPPQKPPAHTPPTMPPDAQRGACRAFLDALETEHPGAAAEGAVYLLRRGVLPAGWPAVAYALPVAAMPAVLDRLRRAPNLADLITAGLVKPPEGGKRERLSWGPWAGDVVLLGHHDRAGRPLAFIARRLDFKPGDALGKYLQQTYSRGAARVPFGLPTLYRPEGFTWTPAPGKAGEVLILEGTLDALGAACLGWRALAFSMRPQAADYDDRAGACPRMLEPHLPALRDAGRVLVVPDDDGGKKGLEGEGLAARLVGWLRFAGVRAEVARLRDLVPDAPAGCKDLADVSLRAGFGFSPEREAAEERAAILEYEAGLDRAEAERLARRPRLETPRKGGEPPWQKGTGEP